MHDKKANNSILHSNTLSLPLGDKLVIWLPDSNKYIVVSPETGKIIERLYKKDKYKSVQNYCTEVFGFSNEEASKTIDLINIQLAEITELKESSIRSISKDNPLFTGTYNCKRYYKINNIVFYFEYETAEIEYLIHPKFAHLEIDAASISDNHFQLHKIDSKVALIVNVKTIGVWSKDEGHFLTGKVSMEILQKIFNNEEKDWMAVFHAAGISNGEESIVFLGDSGNGKSTLSAILMASGYDVLSDDFLPIESVTSLICSFPAAISIKKNAVDLLTHTFPEIKHAHEYVYPMFDKTVKYLSNPNSALGSPKKVPCKALVFVKYDANVKLQFSTLAKDIAFEKLVPDSWISPLEKNAKQFLNWFQEMPCYQLSYSNNESMLATVKNIFDNEI